MPETIAQTEIEASAPVQIPTDNACPECETEMYGHGEDSDKQFILLEHIKGEISLYYTSEEEPAFQLEYECLNCGEEFVEEDLTLDDLTVEEPDV